MIYKDKFKFWGESLMIVRVRLIGMLIMSVSWRMK